MKFNYIVYSQGESKIVPLKPTDNPSWKTERNTLYNKYRKDFQTCMHWQRKLRKKEHLEISVYRKLYSPYKHFFVSAKGNF